MENQEEKIIAYLNEELTPSEKQAFEEKLKNSISLQEELETYQNITFAIAHKKDLDEFKELLNKLALESSSEEVDDDKITTRPIWETNIFRFAVAAIIAVLIAVALWQSPAIYSKSNIYDNYYSSLPSSKLSLVEASELVSDVQDAQVNQLNEAIQHYKDRNYTQAIQLLQTNSLSLSLPEYVLFFRSLCHLELGNFEDAITALQGVTQNQESSFPYNYDANWYLALAYINQGLDAQAIPYLQFLKESSSSYSESASSILEEMD